MRLLSIFWKVKQVLKRGAETFFAVRVVFGWTCRYNNIAFPVKGKHLYDESSLKGTFSMKSNKAENIALKY